MALLRGGLLVVLFVVAVAAREGWEAEDEALLQVTTVDTMAGSQVTPKTWKSPRDLAYVPPPQTVKLSRFLNISNNSAVPSFGRDGNFIALLHDSDVHSHTRLVEWLEFSSLHGVDHFFVYTFQGPEAVAEDVLQPYRKSGIATRIHFQHYPASTVQRQLNMANDGLYRAPPLAQETECADTTVLLQKPRPRAFAHQEWQPLSLASQHIERTASSSHFTVSGSNLRLAIFMTTALSENHRRFFNCWENAIQKFKFLRDADLVLHAPRQLLPDDLAKFQHMRHITVRLSDTTTHGKEAGARKSFKEGFGSTGFHQGWFKDYDWVIRLNPDVLFMDASWILHTMQNASIDGIFQRCLPGCRINTDFFAVRPKAVDFARVDNSTRRNAEGNAAEAFKNILAAGRCTWLEVTQQGTACRVAGAKSSVVHNHSLMDFCPDYLGQRSQQANDDPRTAYWPMERCDFV